MLTDEQIIAALEDISGVSHEDLQFTLSCRNWIATFDHLVFPDAPIEIQLVTKKSEDESIARYADPHHNPTEFYQIFVPGIASTFKFVGMFQEDEAGEVSAVPRELIQRSQKELIVAIASHEVRHRLQESGCVELFSPERINNEQDVLLKAILQYVHSASEKSMEYWRSSFEFDATVIEMMMVHRFHTLEEASNILQLQPRVVR